MDGASMSADRKQLRRELIEARGRIKQQLQILKGQTSSGDPLWGDNRNVIARLEEELRQIKTTLAMGVRSDHA